MERLERLNNPKRRGRKTTVALQKAADQIVSKFHAQDWIDVTIQIQESAIFRQAQRGRPSQRSTYHRKVKQIPKVLAQRNLIGIARSQAMDGIFPLTTNTQLRPLRSSKLTNTNRTWKNATVSSNHSWRFRLCFSRRTPELKPSSLSILSPNWWPV